MTDQVGVAPPERPVTGRILIVSSVGKRGIVSGILNTDNAPAVKTAPINTWKTVTEAQDPVGRQALVKAKARVIEVVTVTGVRQGLEATLPAPNQKSYASFTF